MNDEGENPYKPHLTDHQYKEYVTKAWIASLERDVWVSPRGAFKVVREDDDGHTND